MEISSAVHPEALESAQGESIEEDTCAQTQQELVSVQQAELLYVGLLLQQPYGIETINIP
jgi:hypothetical protein